MTKKLEGKFVVLDGPDGCGKSTQVKLLCQWLSSHGIENVSFRDPGTTLIGEKIRRILLDTANAGMGTRTELLLYMAARAQLWKEQIKPALESGKCVILDRWVSSTCAYQGYAGGFGIDNVIAVGKVCLERLWPDITIILDVNLAVSAARMERELDRMEQKGDSYHKKVRQGFCKLADIIDNCKLIDASNSIEHVHQKILEQIEEIP